MGENDNSSAKPPTLRQVIGSVLASFIGVQSEKNRARDFQHGRLSQFILVGFVATVLFILIIFAIVKLVLSSAGV